MQLLISYIKPVLLANYAQKLRCIVRLKGEALPSVIKERPPLHLAIVLDKSGSMAGHPLREARKCAKFVVSHLKEKDKVSMIAYDQNVEILVPLEHPTNKDAIYQKIDEIQAGSTTNLYDGWNAGVGQLSSVTAADIVSRVLLLSDGLVNEGLTVDEYIQRECQKSYEKGVSTSTYGLGPQFNENLMIGMANVGGGNSYYGETAQDLEDPFMTELELLDALCAKNIRFRLKNIEGEVLNPHVIKDGEWYQASNLVYDGEVWLAFEIPITKEIADQSGDINIGGFEVLYDDLQGIQHALSQDIILPALPSDPYSVIAKDPWVMERLSELEASVIQFKAAQAARRRDWQEVRNLLKKAKRIAGANDWVAAIIVELEKLAKQEDAELFAKEAMYTSSSLSSRMLAQDQDMSFDVEEWSEMPSYLKRKRRQGKGRI